MSPERREAVLKFAIVTVICLCAGPEIFAAIELQILLELLGATLFMTAFIAGARLVLANLGEILRNVALPLAPVAFIFLAYVEWWLATASACVASLHALWALF